MNKDSLELLREFSDREVRFLVVGAHAVSFYAEPRTTGDVDLFVEPTPENAQKVFEALEAFGAPLIDLSAEDLCTPGIVYQMGVPPYRIDILTEISGVSFADAWDGHDTLSLEGLSVPVISLPALLENKRATGREKDLRDLELLRRHGK